MVTIQKGIEAAQEIRTHHVNAKSNPVAWDTSLALEAALTALQQQERRIAGLEEAIRRLAAEVLR
jgi:hypothetical protein